MFDFLNKPTHHHATPQQQSPLHSPPILEDPNSFLDQSNLSNSFIPKKPIKKIVKGILRKPTIVAKSQTYKLQQGQKATLQPQVRKVFQQMLHDSKMVVNDPLVEKLMKNEQSSIQIKVYTKQTATDQNYYLHEMFEKVSIPNVLVKNGLDDLVHGTIGNIVADIEGNTPGYDVFKKRLLSKDDLAQLQKLNQIRMIKIKQGQLTSKVGDLKMQFNFEDQLIQRKARQIVQKDSFNIEDQKTKQAEKYIQAKRLERQEHQRRVQEEKKLKKIREMEKKLQRQNQTQKAKSQRHARLIAKYQAKQLLKKQKQEQMKKQNEKFQQFLKQFKKRKPLYVEKIEQHNKREIEYKRQRFDQLYKRKGNYSSLNIEELQDFQEKYLQLKKQKQEQKRMQLLIAKDEQYLRQAQFRDKNYKGKFRYLVLEQMVEKKAKQKQKAYRKKTLEQKKRAYSVDVKDNFKPKIDQSKRLESQKFIKSERKRSQRGPIRVRLDSANSSNYNTVSYQQQRQDEQPDPRKQGHKNMILMKQYLHEKIRRGQIKTPKDSSLETIQTQIPKINYLKEQRQKRQTQGSSFSFSQIDAEARINKLKSVNKHDVAAFKLKADEYDEKAKRKEQKFRYAEHNPHDQKQLEEDYLTSIKAKLQILKHCK